MWNGESGFPRLFLCLTRLIGFLYVHGAHIVIAHAITVGCLPPAVTIIFPTVTYSSSFLNLMVWEYAYGHIIADKSID